MMLDAIIWFVLNAIKFVPNDSILMPNVKFLVNFKYIAGVLQIPHKCFVSAFDSQ